MKLSQLKSASISFFVLLTFTTASIASDYHHCDDPYHEHHSNYHDWDEDYYDEYDVIDIYDDEYYYDPYDEHIHEYYVEEHYVESHDDADVLGALILGGLIGHVLTKEAKPSTKTQTAPRQAKLNRKKVDPNQYYQSGNDGNCYLMKKNGQTVSIISMVPKHSCQ